MNRKEKLAYYRDYSKEWYRTSKERREQIKKSRERRVLRFRRIVDAYKIATDCADCGYREHAVALDFDHREPKNKHRDVSSMIRSMVALPVLFEEIFKCDVRCSNCHRVRHHAKSSVDSTGRAAGPYKA